MAIEANVANFPPFKAKGSPAGRPDPARWSRMQGQAAEHGSNQEAITIAAVVPLYNGRQYIEAALRSILAQTRPADEIIVIDDGSTDGGDRLVAMLTEHYPIRLLRKRNGGQSSARNYAVERCNSTHIAFLDQDDRWYADHLEKLAQPFLEDEHGSVGWTYSNLDEIDETGAMVCRSFLSTLPAQHPKRDIFHCLAQDMFILPSASLIARVAFETVHGFDEQLCGYEDDDLFLRLFRAGYANRYVDEALSQWRIYPASTSYSPRMMVSRAVYARKLLDTFCDDPERNRFYTRDLIAPRFLWQALSEHRKAVKARSGDIIQAQWREIAYMSRFGSLLSRTVFRLGLPLLRFAPLARVIYACRRCISPVIASL